MSKYIQYRQARPKPRGIHPIWRGIGCLMMLIIPALSFGAAMLTVDAIWTRLPYWMLAPVYLPLFMYNYLPDLTRLLAPVLAKERLVAYLIFTLFLIIFMSGILSVAYAILYKIIGPSPYSPVDAPPPKHRAKPYKR
jgi:hypothetical protein